VRQQDLTLSEWQGDSICYENCRARGDSLSAAWEYDEFTDECIPVRETDLACSISDFSLEENYRGTAAKPKSLQEIAVLQGAVKLREEVR
jgi:hypothetical protein